VQSLTGPTTTDENEGGQDGEHPLVRREGLVRWTFGFALLGVVAIGSSLAADAGVAPFAAVAVPEWLAASAAVGALAACYRWLTA
jgi:hypothetical protein